VSAVVLNIFAELVMGRKGREETKAVKEAGQQQD
jgi:hypothetical protein